MLNSKKTIHSALATTAIFSVTAAVLFASASAHSATVPNNPSPKSSGNSSQNTQSTQSTGSDHTKSESKDRFKVCFYPRTNYRGEAFCKSAPSRIGRFGRRLQGEIRSIKIVDSFGTPVNSPSIKLKVCESEWRRGPCMMLNGSQVDLKSKFPNRIRSYAFDVKS